MTEQGTTRFVAFYTIVLGATFTALPMTMSRFFGMGDRPWLAQYFGVRTWCWVVRSSIPGIPGGGCWAAG